MRITDKQVQQVMRAYSDQIRRQEQKQKRLPPNDVGHEIKLSPQSQEFLAARQILRNLPEVDAERVAQLRQQIEAGTYKVDARRIARNMLAGQHLDTQV
ncbi:MAG: flagellar biosynthesis anti-sigma factor FlgM [Firmicutes bacterium]|nr:flagellar biosynthesis anti-sigma factor FlgM [Bacillota bacterium]